MDGMISVKPAMRVMCEEVFGPVVSLIPFHSLDDVIAEVPYDCDVLLAPHHGSPNSDPPGFAAWSTPEWAVVSGSQRDRLETVTAAYTSRGSQVLHTSTSGAVHVAIAGGQLAVDCWHAGAERGH